MKSTLVPFLIILVFVNLGSLSFSLTAKAEPANIILDTDMAIDVDDAGALAVLNALADNGEANILAVMHDSGYPFSVGCISAINTYYGRGNVPIGAYKGNFAQNEANPYIKQIATHFPNKVPDNSHAPEATELYRYVLSRQPDQSVIVVSIGFFTNLRNLLTSQADRFSPLNGASLIKKKVKLLTVMGGRYPQGNNNFNFGHDGIGPVTKYAIDNWPTPIVFSGAEIGGPILTGQTLSATSPRNPVREAFRLFFDGEFKGRHSWDETAVLVAVRGLSDYWDWFNHGFNFVYPDGSNRWVRQPDKEQAYLIPKMPSERLGTIIESLLTQAPRRP